MFLSKLSTSPVALCAVFVVPGLLVASGCGGGYSGPKATVKGTVTHNGNPVPTGTLVTFISEKGFAASGLVTDGGTYQLSIPNMGEQIPAGSYSVMVSAPAAGATPAEGGDYEAYMQTTNADAAPSAAKPAAAIPARYSSTETSGLTFTVAEGENTIDITL